MVSINPMGNDQDKWSNAGQSQKKQVKPGKQGNSVFVQNNNGTITEYVNDSSGKKSGEITYFDFNGDGEITENEMFTVTKFSWNKDGSVDADTFVDKNGDGFNDEVITYRQERGGVMQQVSSKTEDDMASVKNDVELENRRMSTHKSGNYKLGRKHSINRPDENPVIKNFLNGQYEETEITQPSGHLSIGYSMERLPDGGMKFTYYNRENGKTTQYPDRYVTVKDNKDGTSTLTRFEGAYSNNAIVDSKTGKVIYSKNGNDEYKLNPDGSYSHFVNGKDVTSEVPQKYVKYFANEF